MPYRFALRDWMSQSQKIETQKCLLSADIIVRCLLGSVWCLKSLIWRGDDIIIIKRTDVAWNDLLLLYSSFFFVFCYFYFFLFFLIGFPMRTIHRKWTLTPATSNGIKYDTLLLSYYYPDRTQTRHLRNNCHFKTSTDANTNIPFHLNNHHQHVTQNKTNLTDKRANPRSHFLTLYIR